jgi:hypothetical protein
MAKSKPQGKPHVRVYRWEMDTPAWQTMSCYGRALLIEMRSLYNGHGNRVYMSLREIERRLGIGRKAAEKARDELIERGWVRLLQPASFTLKVKHAPVYGLTHEPLEDRDGATAPKDYMKWTRPEENSRCT